MGTADDTKALTVYVSPDEHEMIEEKAERVNRSKSNFLIQAAKAYETGGDSDEPYFV